MSLNQERLDRALADLTNLAISMGNSISNGKDTQGKPYAEVRKEYEKKLARLSKKVQRLRLAVSYEL